MNIPNDNNILKSSICHNYILYKCALMNIITKLKNKPASPVCRIGDLRRMTPTMSSVQSLHRQSSGEAREISTDNSKREVVTSCSQPCRLGRPRRLPSPLTVCRSPRETNVPSLVSLICRERALID